MTTETTITDTCECTHAKGLHIYDGSCRADFLTFEPPEPDGVPVHTPCTCVQYTPMVDE